MNKNGHTFSPGFEQHQAMRRHTTAWAETLRYRKAEFEAMGGLRRITLNENILIGDRGVTSLAQELTEDLWVKGQGAPLLFTNRLHRV